MPRVHHFQPLLLTPSSAFLFVERINMKQTHTQQLLLLRTRRLSFPLRPSPPSKSHKTHSREASSHLPALTPFTPSTPKPRAFTHRTYLPPLCPNKHTSSAQRFPPVPTLARRFMRGEELLRRIPCGDLMEALLGGEPFADTVLVSNLVRLRKRTESETVLKEEDTDDAQSP